MMRWPSLVRVAVAVLMMTGCKREFGNRNLAELKINMTPKEVESILGSPDRTEKSDVNLETQRKTMAVIKYFYDQDGQTVVVQFQNGRLVGDLPKLKEQ
jgi:hypothetical protein